MMCNPIGCFARCMGNPCVAGLINLFLNICSMVILVIAANNNFTTSNDCGGSFREIAPDTGGLYLKWVVFGGIISSLLACFTLFETCVDIVFDLCLCGKDHNDRCHSILDFVMGVLRSVKKYFMLISNVVEPLFLLHIGFLLAEQAMQAHFVNQTQIDLQSLISQASLLPAQAQQFVNQTQTELQHQISQVKTCVDNRYKLIADSGIGGLLLVIQATVRQFIDVGHFVQEEIEGEEHDTVENYRRAYDRAVPAFGHWGAAALLLGYSDEYEDIELIIKASNVPDGVKGYLVSAVSGRLDQDSPPDSF